MGISTDKKLKGNISTPEIKGGQIVLTGPRGVGIEKIEKTNSSGIEDTYTITYTDGQTSDFIIKNGLPLEFNWDSTKLGIRVHGQTDYSYTDLKGSKGDTGATGPQGPQGETGPQGPSVWGGISGNISSQTDLQNILNAKIEKVVFTDLNVMPMSEFGVYIGTFQSTAQNIPETHDGTVIVQYSSNNYIYETAIIGTSPVNIYTRAKFNGSWEEWKMINAYKSMAVNADFNDIFIPGIYFTGSIPTGQHIPISKTGLLIVFKPNGTPQSGRISTQIYITYDGNEIYTRGYYQSWSDWKDISPIVTITNSNGTAVKFPDGTMICTGKKAFTIASFVAWGSVYSTGNNNVIFNNFPVEFIAPPIVSVHPTIKTGETGGGNFWLGSDTGNPITKSSAGGVQLIRGSTASNFKTTLSYTAIGRWK